MERDLRRDLGPKILIHSPYALGNPNESPNGVPNYIMGLVPYLEAKGFRIRLLGPNVTGEEENAADYILGRAIGISSNMTSSKIGVSLNKGLAEAILLTIRPDIVELQEPFAGQGAHTISSAIQKREDGRPLPAVIGVFHARAEDLDRRTQALLWIAKKVIKKPTHKWGIPTGLTPGPITTVMDLLDGRIAISNATADFWNSIYPSDYEVIYNGINTDKLTPDGPKIESWVDGRQTLLFAGRHDERKGIEYLLEAFRLLSETRRGEIKLKITGKGKMTERLMQMTREMNLIDVEFVGILPREELVKAYRTADILVAPSIGGEGFNRTLAEAMACGTLVIGSDIEGHREALDYQPFTGTFEPKDSHGLAREIAQRLDLPTEAKERLSGQAAEYARRRFSWDTIADQRALHYERILSEHGRPRSEDWPRKERKKKRKMPVSRVVFERLRHR